MPRSRSTPSRPARGSRRHLRPRRGHRNEAQKSRRLRGPPFSPLASPRAPRPSCRRSRLTVLQLHEHGQHHAPHTLGRLAASHPARGRCLSACISRLSVLLPHTPHGKFLPHCQAPLFQTRPERASRPYTTSKTGPQHETYKLPPPGSTAWHAQSAPCSPQSSGAPSQRCSCYPSFSQRLQIHLNPPCST